MTARVGRVQDASQHPDYRPASQPTIDYLKTLLGERVIPAGQLGYADMLWKLLECHEIDVATPGDGSLLPQYRASKAIDWLRGFPRKDGQQPKPRLASAVPAGWYATPSRTGSNDLDFWQVDRPTEGKWAGYVFVKRIIGGRDPQRITRGEQEQALAAIAAAGPDAASALFGQKLGQCGVCHVHLTDDDSRRLGIGPDCRKGTSKAAQARLAFAA